LGGGSNLLFTADFEGLVIKMSLKGIEVIGENEQEVVVKAAAGEDWDQFVNHCVEHRLGRPGKPLAHSRVRLAAAPFKTLAPMVLN
jgi:hypothetical protein